VVRDRVAPADRPGQLARKARSRAVRGRFEQLGLRGTPYYVSRIDGRYYVPQIDEHSGIVSFVHRDGRIADVQVLCDFGPATEADVQRRATHPE